MNSLIKDYELLAHYLKEMIKDGCQIVHGGSLIDWNDTSIPKTLNKIDKQKNPETIPNLKIGDQLKHKLSGQNMTVAKVNEEIISVNPSETPINYPIKQILEEFETIKKIKKKAS